MQCPGQDSRYWDGEAAFETECPNCGHGVEFFKDEGSRNCKKCGNRVLNPKMDFGCAAYCPYAEQCMGALPPELLAQKKDMLKDQVAIEMKKYFAADFKRVGHAGRVARYAEQINQQEKGNPAVVMISAYLHDIGIKEAEEKYGDEAPQYHHQEGPPVAREILKKLKAKEELIEEVCDIIAHHHQPRSEETINFKILYDADLIVNLDVQKRQSLIAPDKLKEEIGKAFFTEAGKTLARRVLLEEDV